MGLLSWLRSVVWPSKGNAETVACQEIFTAATDYAVRRLCFDQCVNLVADALGRCEVRTYIGGSETRGEEYWLWNIEPSTNYNSTAFWHKLVARLLTDNEVLIIPTRKRDGREALVVADSYSKGDEYPTRQTEYKGVTVDAVKYDKTYREGEVLRLRLNHADCQTPVKALTQAYAKLIELADRQYRDAHGRKLKVHVDQVQSGQQDFTAKFTSIIENQIKPFYQNTDAVLPEFDGYSFTDFAAAAGKADAKDVRTLIDDVLAFTARSLLIPYPLVAGDNQDTKDASKRFLTYVVDPIADQLEEEINRKRYGFEDWQKGNFVRIDTSSFNHFDIFDAASNVEKLIGSGLYSINDVLRAAGQQPIGEDWADAHYMTLNISGLGQAAKQL